MQRLDMWHLQGGSLLQVFRRGYASVLHVPSFRLRPRGAGFLRHLWRADISGLGDIISSRDISRRGDVSRLLLARVRSVLLRLWCCAPQVFRSS